MQLQRFLASRMWWTSYRGNVYRIQIKVVTHVGMGQELMSAHE